MRLIGASLTVAVALAIMSSGALAINGDEDADGGDPDVEVGGVVRTLGPVIEVIVWSDGGVVSLPGVFPQCSWQRVRVGDVLLPNVNIPGVDGSPEENFLNFLRVVHDDGRVEHLYLQVCLFRDGTTSTEYVLIEDGNAADSVAAARLELIELAPEPVGALSPTLGVDHLVGLASWVWLETQPDPVVASAAIPGLTTTATATASSLTITPGDGAPSFGCELDSPRYSEDLDAASGCNYMFELVSERAASGRWDMSLDLVWEVTWVNSLGDSGTADPIITTAVYPLTVIELQARIVAP